MIGGSASLASGPASLDMEQTFCKVAAIEETVQRSSGQRWRAKRSRRAASAALATLQADDRLVQRREEVGAVARRERLWAAGDLAGIADVLQEVARGERHADRVLGEGAAVRRDDCGARLDTPAGERHVCGDDDVAAAGALGDPVVRLVHPAA